MGARRMVLVATCSGMISIHGSVYAGSPTGQPADATAGLYTRSGNSIGLSYSDYRYSESPGTAAFGWMHLTAAKIGVDYSHTWLWRNDWSAKADFRYAYGNADYDSSNSGMIKGIRDWYTDTRALIGRDFAVSGWGVVTPFSGLGYRYLSNDTGGMVSTTGARGYWRENELFYLPVGIDHKYPLGLGSRMVTDGEADILLRGKQKSHLSDVDAAFPDVSNNQHSGYGLRLSIMYEQDHGRNAWSAGPWITYWHIANSQIVSGTVLGQPFYAFEPRNTTTEGGIRVIYKF